MQEITKWVFRGVADARDRTPGHRAPAVSEEELCMREGEASPEVTAYWQGWYSGVLDGVHDTLRRMAR